MSKASYEHNKCSECKEDEMAIKEGGMQEIQVTIRRSAAMRPCARVARRSCEPVVLCDTFCVISSVHQV